LPTNALFLSASLSQGASSRTNGALTCAFGSLPKGGSAVATLRLQASAPGVALAAASVVADQADANPADNNASANVVVQSGSPSTATLVVQASPAAGGTVSGGGTFLVGSSQTLSASASPGWGFFQWQDANTSNPRNVTVPAAGATFTAYFTNASPTGGNGFTNRNTLVIHGGSAAAPYPSLIQVAGFSGTLKTATVTLHGLSDSDPLGAGFLLVGPQGQEIILMANAGGHTTVSGLELTFDDASTNLLNQDLPLTSASYHPGNPAEPHAFPAPAPGEPYATSLATLAGTNPNGAWALYVNDLGGASGSLAQGWSLSLQAAASAPARLTAPLARPGGQFQFTLSGAPGSSYQVEVSSNLKTWTLWRTVVLAGVSTNLIDSASASNRFYRTVQ